MGSRKFRRNISKRTNIKMLGILILAMCTTLASLSLHFYSYDSKHRQEIDHYRSYESYFITMKDKVETKEMNVNMRPVLHSDRLFDSQIRADAITALNFDPTRDYGAPYYYNQSKFQNCMMRWRKKIHDNLHVLVIIQQPISSQFPKDLILQTLRDSLTSKTAQVALYLSNHDTELVSLFTRTFAKFIEIGQLILLLSERVAANSEKSTLYPNLIDGFNYAYLLDLAYQSKSNFTLMLPPGWHLNVNATDLDYVVAAVEHHKGIVNNRESINDFTRTCWTTLSDNGESDVILLNTTEDTSRLSILLRSSLPYNQKSYTELRKSYCTGFISNAAVVCGPSMFTNSLSHLVQPQTALNIVSNAYTHEKDIVVPRWIDSTLHLGPQLNVVKPPYTIAFAVTAMMRPVVNSIYLENFMNSLLDILEMYFNDESQFSAIIVVLVAGQTIAEIKSLRTFLEGKYTNAIQRKMISLVDSPVESYTDRMSTMRSTYHIDSHHRRYWRSKQNLDVGSVFRATIGLCEYVMLLEDDTGFQPEFANRLTSILHDDYNANYTPDLLPWSQMEFGFGYSGILIRAIDVPVYEQLHTTFFDEEPCDLLDIWLLVRDGKRIYINSPYELSYNKQLYLKHFGYQSSLQGKTQEVW